MTDFKGRQLVVSGTDTGIGKTLLSALLVAALDADYWKPVQAGLEEGTDSEAVLRISRTSPERIHPESYRLLRPASPDQAAAAEGIRIDIDQIRPPRSSRTLIIEGAGGLLVPFNEDYLQIDLYARWNIPVILTARSTLGTLNHTLLSLEALQRRKIPVAGIVLSGPEHPDNIQSLEQRIDAPIIGTIPPLQHIDRDTLLALYEERFRRDLLSAALSRSGEPSNEN